MTTTNRSKCFRSQRHAARGAGYSLLEMLVSLTITIIIMVGVLEMFEMNAKLARKQTLVADMQQNLRVGMYDILRYVRMAGRGGLPAFVPPNPATGFGGSLLPAGVAVAVQNNVGTGVTVGGNPVLPGTDILTVRGVIFGPIFQVQSNTEDFDNRRLQLDMLALGVPQELEAIADATMTPGSSETLILVSSRGATLYGLAEIAAGGAMQTAADADGKIQTVGVTVPFTTNGVHKTDYKDLMLDGDFPGAMTAAAYMGILEEYRYYIRAAPVDPADPASDIVPRLSRARFFPGSETVHPSNPTAREDIADNVWDMQIALGVDRNNDGEAVEGAKDADKKTDEWLFNHAEDAIDDPGTPGTWRWNGNNNPIHSLRLSLLVRSERPEIQYVSEPIKNIEDHVLDEKADPADADELAVRRYRRKLMQTTVDFRNF
ncbi:MAG: PilW family protein [Acidimicrobiia bacterium]|nr:PilW family protein [Acidimicrobiia bacterium]